MKTRIILFIIAVVISGLHSGRIEFIQNYFETSGNRLLQFDILPEYEVERYVFPTVLPDSKDKVGSDEDTDGTVLYRIVSGPKSPRADGKRPSLIQHGILCESSTCNVNKPQIAVAYLLVDQGYDVWLGLSNSSMAENSISSESIEKQRLENVAQYILLATQQPELLVMGYFNGAVQFFGITAKPPAKEPSTISKWIEKIPGVRTAKKWYSKIYDKGRTYITKSYDRVVAGFDNLGKKLDYIIDDQPIRNLKNIVLNAWGIVTSMVAPTLSIEDFSKMIHHPDVYLNTPQLITKYGYTGETHEVMTEDGYILALHRISGSKKFPAKSGKPVVLLQHGLLASSAVWILAGPSKGLGYILADHGYDVWMGNSRGNTYSRNHVNILNEDSAYWNFSWHEMGIYDLPAAIDYILHLTKQEKLYYLGHSQGSTSFFVMMSEKPEYNNKIHKFAALAPIVYTKHIRSPVLKLMAKISKPVSSAFELFKIYDFAPNNAMFTKMGRDSCEARSLYQVICSNSLFMVTGYNVAQINKTLVPIIMGHLPAGSSVKQLLHYGQEINAQKFQKFDYNSPEKNIEKHGQSEPPEYNVSNVKVPVGIFYSSNDLLSAPQDIEKLADDLPNVKILYKVPMVLFNHIDFMFAIDAPALVYQPTLDFFNASTKS